MSDPGSALLVRHGETEWSRLGRHTSTTDLPLTAEGEAAAAWLREELGGREFALVLTSPRIRARRTAEIAGFADAQVDPDLAEWDYGDYEGLTRLQIQESVPDWTIWSHPAPGGESAAQVAARTFRVIQRIRGAAGPVLIFGHGHALRALGALWVGEPTASGGWLYLSTASVSELGFDHADPVIRRWNAGPARGARASST